VRILLVDWRLSRAISGHDVKTVHQMRWETIKNGELLARASKDFDVFVTVDQGLSFQQNIATLTVAVIVLKARTNRLADLVPLVPGLLGAIGAAKPGTVTVVSGP
jgi:hypothetical protein